MLKADTQAIRPSWITLNERGDTMYAVREETPEGGVYELKMCIRDRLANGTIVGLSPSSFTPPCVRFTSPLSSIV